jgi:hypothetical protein
MITPPPHAPVTLFVGTYECIERECPEYLTADGYDDPAIERCSHVTTEVVCILCSVEDDGLYHETTPWPCADSAAQS